MHLPAVRLATAAVAALLAGAALAATPGQPAPDFTVNDTSGKPVKLSEFRGKYVVLEWTNPECPFVQKHYNAKNMQALQKECGAKDVVWLSVNSTSRDHSEYKDGAQMAAWMQKQGGAPKAVLIDDASTTGRAYAATHDAAHVRHRPRRQGRLRRRDRRQALAPTRRTSRARTTTSAPR